MEIAKHLVTREQMNDIILSYAGVERMIRQSPHTGRERSLALTKLEESRHWLIAAVEAENLAYRSDIVDAYNRYEENTYD